MSSIIFTPSQARAYAAMKRGENVFLTGGAGTGKTTLIKEFIKDVDPECKKTLLCAPTGKAALNMSIKTRYGEVQGSTIHRLFGIKAETAPQFRGGVPKLIQNAERIIIDEISMCRMDVFDYVADTISEEVYNNFIRSLEGRPLQIILVGDFFQLPPVVRTTAAEGNSDKEILNAKYRCDIGKAYCFQSPGWDTLDIKTHELTEIMRQKDVGFCDALNKIRIGDPSGIDFINKNCDHSPFQPDRITLCGTNRNADAINDAMLQRNPNEKITFQWDIESKIQYPDSYLKNVQCVKNLTLCKGARVICIANNPSAVNGQMGEVTYVGEDHVRVKWDGGEENRVDAYEWEIARQELKEGKDGKKEIKRSVVLKISQLPLKIAYAITIHKSQGETLPAANIMTDTFETGHLYTALSRCADVHKMRLRRQLRPADVKSDKIINIFYESVEYDTD